MPKFLRRTVRSLAGLLILALAVVSLVQCAFGNTKTAKPMLCCAAMHHDCGEMAVLSCCTGHVQQVQGVVATKSTVACVPVAALLAVLVTPPPGGSSLPRASFTVESRSAGPPGVPTYLFVSSFRI